MKVRIRKLGLVDVARSDCGTRECFVFGFDKGPYAPGRGYTDYYRDSRGRLAPRRVCMTRHLRGCPIHSVCPACRSTAIDEPGSMCRCGAVRIAREET